MEVATAAARAAARHAVGFFDDDHGVVRAVTPFLADGLVEGEVVAVYVRPLLGHALRSALAERLGSDELDDARRSGRYLELDAERTLAGLVDADGLRPDRLAATRDELAGSRRPGRVFGEMVDLLWQAGRHTDALELESAWAELSREVGLLLQCAYRSPGAFTAGLDHLGDLCNAHDHLLTAPMSAPHGDASGVEVTGLPVVGAVAGVRDLVRDALGGWGVERGVDEVLLVASELATNAVLHAGTGWRLDLRRAAGHVRIEVTDAAPDPPVRCDPALSSPGGRGIAIVEQLSDAWGSRPGPDGTKVVWADVAVPG